MGSVERQIKDHRTRTTRTNKSKRRRRTTKKSQTVLLGGFNIGDTVYSKIKADDPKEPLALGNKGMVMGPTGDKDYSIEVLFEGPAGEWCMRPDDLSLDPLEEEPE